MLRFLRIFWASPNTALGLLLVAINAVDRGQARIVGGVLEAHGPLLRRFLESMPMIPGGAAALTLGHVVVGVSQRALDLSRTHERIHVAQYERWGPLFLPAYFCASLACWLHGKDPYRDNPFEVEAYSNSDLR